MRRGSKAGIFLLLERARDFTGAPGPGVATPVRMPVLPLIFQNSIIVKDVPSGLNENPAAEGRGIFVSGREAAGRRGLG